MAAAPRKRTAAKRAESNEPEDATAPNSPSEPTRTNEPETKSEPTPTSAPETPSEPSESRAPEPESAVMPDILDALKLLRQPFPERLIGKKPINVVKEGTKAECDI